MIHLRKILSFLLCAVILFGIVPISVSATEMSGFDNFTIVKKFSPDYFSDVSASNWYYDNVKAVYELGLMIGQGEIFGTDNSITVAEAVTIAARIHSIFVGDEESFPLSTPWYQIYIDYFSDNINSYINKLDFNAPATRAQCAGIFGAALPSEAYDVINMIGTDSIPDVKSGDSYSNAIYMLYRAGIFVGNDEKGSFAPNTSIKRKEIAAIVTRIIDKNLRKSITLGKFFSVTFNLNYDKKIKETVFVEAGTSVSAPENPKRKGYSFRGWYTTSLCRKKYDFSSIVTDDLVLYARWVYLDAVVDNNTSYSITFDSNGGSHVDAQQIKLGGLIIEPTNVIRAGYTLDGWYTDINGGVKFNFQTPVTSNLILYAHWIPRPTGETDIEDTNSNGIPDLIDQIMEYGSDSYDSDLDGVPNYFESLYGTKIDVADTDLDGLPDGYELYILGTSPLKMDSDENGVYDNEEDADNDGISNLLEYKLGTNPLLVDTDKDSLTDFQESFLYGTDPLERDTDKDGLNDNDEILYQMNPLNPITLNDGILDGNRVFKVIRQGNISNNSIVTPKLEIELRGNQIESLSIEQIENSDVFLNSSIPGYIGNAYELNVEGSFAKATLSFQLEDSQLSENVDPAIYYWDENNQRLEELTNQTRKGNTLTAELSHFSSYIVLDREKYSYSVLEYEVKPPTSEDLQNKTFDIFLVLDESGSISRIDFSLMKQLSCGLLNYLTDDDRVGVITFDSYVRKIIGLSNKADADQAIKGLSQHGGSTALYDAIYEAINEFTNSSTSTKVIISLTDGIDNRSHNSPQFISDKAVDSNIIIYTIGVGSNINKNDLSFIAESTFGQYFSASNFDELSGVFDRIISDADLYKDSDDDGISDYHEKAISNGKLKLGNGASVDSAIHLNYLSSDSDGDGLSDGDEIEIRQKIENGKEVCYCYLYSNPCLSDTDGDGLNDQIEDYAGFDPLQDDSIHGFIGTTNSTLPRNSFSEWKQLTDPDKDGKAWNYIHNIVETEIRSRNSFLLNQEYRLTQNGKLLGRVDLLAPSYISKIWEVKPASYVYDPLRYSKGIAQLNHYISLAPICDGEYKNLSIGDGSIADGLITTVVDYEIEYINHLDGLIIYHFTRKKPVPVSVPDLVPEEETEDEKVKSWQENMWEVARELGYNAAEFGNWLLECFKSLADSVYEHIKEIVEAGVAIGGLIGILYIIVNVAPYAFCLA